MPDLRGFRETVRDHRRAVGRTQQQLARSVGLHPDVLSHKLNGRDRAALTTPDVIGIATTLASWGALVSRADVYELLDLMDVPRQAIPAAAWSALPLAGLRADHDGGPGSHPADEPAGPGRAAARNEPAARHRVTPAPLPAPATQLIGRRRERAEVAAAVAVSRLVTLTGAGGTGKTRLALHVARDLAGDFADGVAFIDLAPVRDPAVLATAVARALGLAPASAEAAEDYLAEALRDRELLLVVDNLEHLLDETPLLSRMLTAAPALRLLATSRIPLRLYGEHTVRVPPLHLPGKGATGTDAADSEAVQLFIVRARSVRSGFAPDADELAAVGEICAALDGLPLAIELAAARIRLYSPRALLPLLQSRLELLTGGPRDLPRRQQTLRAALDWSHALLPPGTRRLFARLSVFAGPFDAEAAAAVSAEPDPVRTLEHLADVADQSLLEVTAGEPPRFGMLQTVREYGQARLAETGEQDTVRRRHLAHYLSMAHAARQELDGPRQAELLDRLEEAYPNMRAALDFAWHQASHDSACLEQGLRMAAALTRSGSGAGRSPRASCTWTGCSPSTTRCSAPAFRGSGPRPCWPPARWPASRATTPGRCSWPGTASSCADRWATTGAWPGRTASSARRPSARATTPRPSRISGVSWPRRVWPATCGDRLTPATCSPRPAGTRASSAGPAPCSGRR
jgi:predicted ATPase